MSNSSRWSLANAALLGIGVLTGASFISTPAVAQTTFPDVEPSYWAQPFIERLAAQNIISGYPDGTFRPEQPLDRDEFAALIRDAFNQNEVQQIPSGSVFKDVPNGYWAASAIEEAYEAGFMRGFPGGFFRPREEVSRVQALVSLVNGLNLEPANLTASPNQTTTNQPGTNQTTTNQATTTNQTTTRRATKRPIFFPLAITSLMQSAVMASTNGQRMPPSPTTPSVTSDQSAPSSRPTTPSATSDQSVSFSRPASSIVSENYIDAEKIPGYAVDDVAAATKANIVVNYPNPRILNPSEPVNRGVAAALIYQTLVHQGRLSPLPSSVEASNYIVAPAAK